MISFKNVTEKAILMAFTMWLLCWILRKIKLRGGKTQSESSYHQCCKIKYHVSLQGGTVVLVR